MDIYVDTSVLAAFMDNNDPNHISSDAILNNRFIKFYTGTITLLELESFIARNIEKIEFLLDPEIKEELTNLSSMNKIHYLVSYCFQSVSLTLTSSFTLENIDFNNQEIELENTYNLAWIINADLKLRTLDAIQICSAIKMRIYDSIEIQYFLTNDQNILNQKTEIFQKSRILPISTESLREILESRKVERNNKEEKA